MNTARKAILAGVGALLAGIGTALLDTHLSPAELFAALGAGVTAAGVVYQVPNAAPQQSDNRTRPEDGPQP